MSRRVKSGGVGIDFILDCFLKRSHLNPITHPITRSFLVQSVVSFLAGYDS